MNNNKFKPKVIADEQVHFEGSDKKENFTHFEELIARVKQLEDLIDEHAEVLRYNDLVRKKTIEAPYFDEDEVYKKLYEEE